MPRVSCSLLYFFVATVAFVLAVGARAEAHQIGISTGEYTRRGSSLVGKLSFARSEVAALVAGIDTNLDGHLSPAEVASGRGVLQTKILGRIIARSGGEACAATLTDAGLLEEDGLVVSGRWDCRAMDQPIEVDLAVLDDLARGHRHLARTVVDGAHHDKMATRGDARLSLAPAASGTSGGSGPAEAKAEPRPSGALAFLVLGIEHILTGYDHLLFLLGLVLVRSSLRGLLATVTAFTVAHSVTLAIATLGIWMPSSRIVEPVIALSVAYVGVENFFVEDGSRRWRITFPFGLVHGFGFASALRELDLPRAEIPAALVAFNVGVESGQLAVVALALPILAWLRRRSGFTPWGVRAISGGVTLAGIVWFVLRASDR